MKTLFLPSLRAATCALLLAGSSLSAAAIDWSASGSGNWSLGTNWSGGTAPSSGDTATIAGTSGNQTVTYDSSASGQLGTLNLDQAAAGFTNTLDVSKTGNSTTPSLLIANDVTLGGGSTQGTAQLQLETNAYLQIGSTGQGNLTIGQNATLTSQGNASTPKIAATVILTDGGTMTLNTSTAADTRTIILGNFTATGGTIQRVAGTSTQGLLQLQGTTNSIGSGVTFVGAPYIYLNSTSNQTLSSDTSIADLDFRAASGVKTLSGAGTFGSIIMGGFTSANNLTIKLGSNLTTTNGCISGTYGGAAGSSITVDANGYNLTTSTTLDLVSDATANWTLTNSSAMPATISGSAIVFQGGSNYTISGPLTIDATSTSSFAFGNSTTSLTVSGPVTLESAGNISLNGLANSTIGSGVTLQSASGTSNLGGTGTIDPNSTFYFNGTSGSMISNRTIGNVIVGDGTNASALTRTSANLSLAGNLQINQGSTYKSGGWSTKFSGSGGITGTGIYSAINSTGNITWASGSTGGFSLGATAGQIGQFTLSAAGTVSGIPTVTLISTSVSTFDVAGIGSFDSVNLGAFNAVFAGTLSLNFINSYTPQAGDTFQLFSSSSELNSSSVAFTGTTSGTFGSITSNLGADYAFSFDGTTGVLTVVSAIPEPSATVLLSGLAALLGVLVRKRHRALR